MSSTDEEIIQSLQKAKINYQEFLKWFPYYSALTRKESNRLGQLFGDLKNQDRDVAIYGTIKSIFDNFLEAFQIYIKFRDSAIDARRLIINLPISFEFDKSVQEEIDDLYSSYELSYQHMLILFQLVSGANDIIQGWQSVNKLSEEFMNYCSQFKKNYFKIFRDLKEPQKNSLGIIPRDYFGTRTRRGDFVLGNGFYWDEGNDLKKEAIHYSSVRGMLDQDNSHEADKKKNGYGNPDYCVETAMAFLIYNKIDQYFYWINEAAESYLSESIFIANFGRDEPIFNKITYRRIAFLNMITSGLMMRNSTRFSKSLDFLQNWPYGRTEDEWKIWLAPARRNDWVKWINDQKYASKDVLNLILKNPDEYQWKDCLYHFGQGLILFNLIRNEDKNATKLLEYFPKIERTMKPKLTPFFLSILQDDRSGIIKNLKEIIQYTIRTWKSDINKVPISMMGIYLTGLSNDRGFSIDIKKDFEKKYHPFVPEACLKLQNT